MMHIRLSTALLLATSCVLWTAVCTKSVTICEGNAQRLSCDTGVVKVRKALLGAEGGTCCECRPLEHLANTGGCSPEYRMEAINMRCQGEKECELSPAYVRESDPCASNSKNVQIEYSCIPHTQVHTCEGSTAQLKCDEGKVIQVLAAEFGRQDMAICSSNRPESQISNIKCRTGWKAYMIVSDSCGGKNSCSVKAATSVFGEPCGGIFKYLEVDYVCDQPE